MDVRRAGTVIIGGGIAGVSAAYFLAEQGLDGIVVIDRERLGGGCTGGSMGGVRQQFSTPRQVELAVRGRRFWDAFESRFGQPLAFDAEGYLLVTGQAETLECLGQAATVQAAQGAGEVEIIDPKQIAELTPWLSTDGLIGGSWTPRDGRMNPTDGLYGIARSARERGVQFIEGVSADGLQRHGDRWMVRTPDGAFDGERVVVTAGLGTPALLAPFGVDLPIHPMVIHSALSDSAPPGRVPLTLDLDTGLFVDRHAPGLCLTVFDPEASVSVDATMERFAALAPTRVPTLADVGIRSTWTAVADATGGDGHPFIGEIEDGLWVLAGFDAHGTMQAPAAAELLTTWIAGGSDPHIVRAVFDPLRRPAPPHEREWMRASKHDAAPDSRALRQGGDLR